MLSGRTTTGARHLGVIRRNGEQCVVELSLFDLRDFQSCHARAEYSSYNSVIKKSFGRTILQRTLSVSDGLDLLIAERL